jgi:hypothetical protein
VKVGNFQNTDCENEVGCDYDAFKTVELSNGDTVRFLDPVLEHRHARYFFKMINRTNSSELSIIGAPTTIISSPSQSGTYKTEIILKKINFKSLSFENFQTGMFFAENSTLNFDDIEILGARSKNLPFFSFLFCNVSMNDITFVNNSVRQSMLINISNSNFTLRNSDFSHNVYTAQKEFGLFHFKDSNFHISDVIFKRNNIKICLFAVQIGCIGTLDDLVMDHNKVFALVVVRASANVSFHNSMVKDNQGNLGFIQFGNMQIDNLTIINQGQDGVLFVVYSAQFSCVNTRVFGGKFAHVAGLAAQEGPCRAHFVNTEITSTRVSKSFFSIIGAKLEIENCSFINITGQDSDLIHSVEGNIIVSDTVIKGYQSKNLSMSLFYVASGNLDVRRINISDMKIAFVDAMNSSISVKDCTVSSIVVLGGDNLDDICGIISATQVRGSVSIVNSNFTNCTAPFGVVAVLDGILEIERSCFVNNSGVTSGSIWDQSVSCAITDCIFVNNSARLRAGVVYSDATNVSVKNVLFENNVVAVANGVALLLGAERVFISEVSSRKGQSGFLYTEINSRYFRIENSLFAGTYKEAIVTPNTAPELANCSFNCRFRCAPALHPSTLRNEGEVSNYSMNNTKWFVEIPKRAGFSRSDVVKVHTKLPSGFWQYYVVPWAIVGLAVITRKSRRKVKKE